MFEFWYSERCTREIKLIICILTCVAIYTSSTIEKLAPLFVGLSLFIGVSIHCVRLLILKIKQNNVEVQKWFKILFNLILIIAIIILILSLPKQHQIALTIQCLGFSAIGFFIVSIHQNRAKRF